MNLHDIDLNLLKVLDVLLRERSVTRAGEVLGRTQPAVSNALQRLRTVLNDDLFVRGSSGLMPTPRAEAMREPLREIIALLENSLLGTAPFDPAAATGSYRISTPDRHTIAVIPMLLERLQKHAPHMSLQVITADRKQALDLLLEDRTDLALGWIDNQPLHLSSDHMLDEGLFCVMRRAHPLMKSRKKFDIDSVLSFPHLVVSATGERTAIFDDLLARQGLKRNAAVTLSNFTAVPDLLSRSNMIGVFTRLAADVFEKVFGLAKRPVPINVGKIVTQMVWNARVDRDEKHCWLRQQIKSVYRDL